eukprot:CAMPEP_0184498592 /NCGR_PEP_ID=MMETSP0113_2-20130426/39381_1 /TAXON_ID=91329 /ORGANISM="Norrisiella sphaerica, Strain BC52" /LENGTH=1402 /DNA_ID=CAMNT_0026886185 /DNA_START=353 /DNA_END=4558 /DNA_ORIENTATION=+
MDVKHARSLARGRTRSSQNHAEKDERKVEGVDTSAASVLGGVERHLPQKLYDDVRVEYIDRTGLRYIFKEILSELFSYEILPKNPYPFVIRMLEILNFGHFIFHPLLPDPTKAARYRNPIGRKRMLARHGGGGIKVCSASMSTVWGVEMIVSLIDRSVLARIHEMLNPLFEVQEVFVSHDTVIQETAALVGPVIFSGSFIGFACRSIEIVRDVIINTTKFEKALKLYPNHLINLASVFEQERNGMFMHINIEGGSRWHMRELKQSAKTFSQAVRLAVLSDKAITIHGLWRVESLDKYMENQQASPTGTWFVLNEAKETADGPYKFSKLKELLTHGDIKLDTFIWKEGIEEWKPLQNYKCFKRIIGAETFEMDASHLVGEGAAAIKAPGDKHAEKEAPETKRAKEETKKVGTEIVIGEGSIRRDEGTGGRKGSDGELGKVSRANTSDDAPSGGHRDAAEGDNNAHSEGREEEEDKVSRQFPGPILKLKVTKEHSDTTARKNVNYGFTNTAVWAKGGLKATLYVLYIHPGKNGVGDVPDCLREIDKKFQRLLPTGGFRIDSGFRDQGGVIPVKVNVLLHFEQRHSNVLRHMSKDRWIALLTGVFFSDACITRYGRIYAAETSPFDLSVLRSARGTLIARMGDEPILSSLDWTLSVEIVDLWIELIEERERKGSRREETRSISREDSAPSRDTEGREREGDATFNSERKFVDTTGWTLLQHMGMSAEAVTVFSSTAWLIGEGARQTMGPLIAELHAFNNSAIGRIRYIISQISTFFSILKLAQAGNENKPKDLMSTLKWLATELFNDSSENRLAFAQYEVIGAQVLVPQLRGLLRLLHTIFAGKTSIGSNVEGKAMPERVAIETTRRMLEVYHIMEFTLIRYAPAYFFCLFAKWGQWIGKDKVLLSKFQGDGVKLETEKRPSGNDKIGRLELSIMHYIVDCELDRFMEEALLELGETKPQNFLVSLIARARESCEKFENWAASDAFLRLSMQGNPIGSEEGAQIFSISIDPSSALSSARKHSEKADSVSEDFYYAEMRRKQNTNKLNETGRRIYGNWMSLAVTREEHALEVIHDALAFSQKIFPLKVKSSFSQAVVLHNASACFGASLPWIDKLELKKFMFISGDVDTVSGFDFAKQVVLFVNWVMHGNRLLAYKLAFGGESYCGDQLEDLHSLVHSAIPFSDWLEEDDESAVEFSQSDGRPKSPPIKVFNKSLSTSANILRQGKALRALQNLISGIGRCAKSRQPVIIEGLFCCYEGSALSEYWPMSLEIVFVPLAGGMRPLYLPGAKLIASISLRFEGLYIDRDHALRVHSCYAPERDLRGDYQASLKEKAVRLLEKKQYIEAYSALLKFFMLREDFLSKSVASIGRMYRSLAGEVFTLGKKLSIIITVAKKILEHGTVRRAW